MMMVMMMMMMMIDIFKNSIRSPFISIIPLRVMDDKSRMEERCYPC
jgi:hypothetical protein